MKQKMIVVLLLLPMVMTVMAQGPDREMKHKQRLDQMAEELNLTSEQRALIEDLNKKHWEQMKPLMEDRKANATQIKALHKEHQQEVKSILTPEQLARLKEIKKARHENMKKMRSELKTYRQSNIEPVIRQKRTDFDKELTDAERKTIGEMRLKISPHRKEMAKDRNRHNGRKVPIKSEKHKAGRLELKKTLEPIITAHKASLDSIRLSLEPQKTKWEADISAILAKYKDPNAGPTDEGLRRRKKSGKDPNPEEKEMNEAIRFLLMKPVPVKK